MLRQEEESELKSRIRKMMLELVEEFGIGLSVIIDPQGSNVHVEMKRQYSTPDVCKVGATCCFCGE